LTKPFGGGYHLGMKNFEDSFAQDYTGIDNTPENTDPHKKEYEGVRPNLEALKEKRDELIRDAFEKIAPMSADLIMGKDVTMPNAARPVQDTINNFLSNMEDRLRGNQVAKHSIMHKLAQLVRSQLAKDWGLSRVLNDTYDDEIGLGYGLDDKSKMTSKEREFLDTFPISEVEKVIQKNEFFLPLKVTEFEEGLEKGIKKQ